jgi:hypothetical protein
MTATRKAARKAAIHTFSHQGGTFDAATLEPVTIRSGYGVAVKSLGRGNGALASLDYVTDRLYDAVIGRGAIPYIGTWLNRNFRGNYEVYIDRVVVLPDRDSALILARALNEIAVWDYADEAAISVADTCGFMNPEGE